MIFILNIFSFLLYTDNVFADEVSLPPSITVNVYDAPSSIVVLNKAYLIYEMYLTSYMPTSTTLTSLEAADGHRHFMIAHDDLAKSIQTIKPNDKKNPFIFQPGESKILYMWLSFDKLSQVPSKLKHEFTFTTKGKIYNLPYSELAVNGNPPVIISTPLRGCNWYVGSGLSNTARHRRAAIYFYGRPYFSERYAIDFMRVGANGKTFAGDSHKNASYHCYNQNILAVANGKVSR